MRKICALLTALTLLLCMFGGCKKTCQHEWGREKGTFDRFTGVCNLCGAVCEHEWNKKTGACSICKKYCEHTLGTSEEKACEICGYTIPVEVTTDVVGATTEFAVIPHTWDWECPEKGTVERLYYDTDAYGDGTTYHKYVLVYLPYGYNQADTSKKYNVVYFQHANGSNRELILSNRSLNVIDNMFYRSAIEPLIIVCTTFYMDDTSTVAFDGWSEETQSSFQFYKEVTEDILPAVESHYNTYAESCDAEGLIASRDHRAFTGFSRGANCTWNMFCYAFEYFRWYSPMSCNFVGAGKEAFTNEEAFEALKASAEAHPGMPYFIFAASGGDRDIPAVRGQIRDFLSHNYFSYGKDPEKDNFFYLLSDYDHGNYASDYYYNSLQVFFH